MSKFPFINDFTLTFEIMIYSYMYFTDFDFFSKVFAFSFKYFDL